MNKRNAFQPLEVVSQRMTKRMPRAFSRRCLRHAGMPGCDRAARRGGGDRAAQERSAVAKVQSGIRVSK
jgi:hypothetical protein